MGRFMASEADNYGGNGGAGYFTLKNDGDVARVRFMYTGIDDVDGYAVHEVEIDGKKRYVNCIRNYNDPVDKCPFCKAKMYQRAKLFIPLYDVDDGRVKLWERGKKYFSKITSLCARYPDLVSHVFEIERNGKAGSTQTTYEIYEVDHDDTKLSDLPEQLDILGNVVLDKTAEEMEQFLNTGSFDDGGVVVRRRSTSDETEDRFGRRRETREADRRTPSNREVF